MQKIRAMSYEIHEALMQMTMQMPEAFAEIHGSDHYPLIRGHIYFFSMWGGTMAVVDVDGLPHTIGTCTERVYGFHVHAGKSCEPADSGNPFALTEGHYNPENCPHPRHAGDLPPLFGNNGYAFQIVYTNRFVPEEIIGKTIIIHEAPDDFTTQPSGNSGEKIACGEIKSYMDNNMHTPKTPPCHK